VQTVFSWRLRLRGVSNILLKEDSFRAINDCVLRLRLQDLLDPLATA
jgi:hypothetical protein